MAKERGAKLFATDERYDMDFWSSKTQTDLLS